MHGSELSYKNRKGLRCSQIQRDGIVCLRGRMLLPLLIPLELFQNQLQYTVQIAKLFASHCFVGMGFSSFNLHTSCLEATQQSVQIPEINRVDKINWLPWLFLTAPSPMHEYSFLSLLDPSGAQNCHQYSRICN